MASDTTSNSVRAVLCDLDGVLRHWDAAASIETEFGLAVGSIRACAFSSDLIIPAITGACTDEEWRSAIAERLTDVTSMEAAEMVVSRWSESPGHIDMAMLELIESVRGRGQRVILVTNATTRLMDDLTALRIHDRFDGIVNSAEVGSAKPDHAIYRVAAELAGAAPAECVFIDDLAENVATATELGMTGVHFMGIESVHRILV